MEPRSHYAAITRAGGAKFWLLALPNLFITVAERELMLPRSLTKRLVNHARPQDVAEGYAANWTVEQMRVPAQRIADRIDTLAPALRRSPHRTASEKQVRDGRGPAPVPERVLSFEHARQAMRVIRERTDLSTGQTTTETVYAITSVTPDRAGPEQLLAWNGGHWAVEDANHYRRDASLGEDASRLRARHAPANNATLNNIALAIVFHRGFRHVPEANLHFMMRREDALDAILSPT